MKNPKLFSFFEAIDKQFLNLHRTVIREQDQQERIESDFLSSMWAKVIGVNASKLRKYEKNRELLQSVRDRTGRHKHVLVDHNQRLLQMKASLERLRQRLVSPLVRNTNSSTLPVDEQIRGLEGTYNQLRTVRGATSRRVKRLRGASPDNWLNSRVRSSPTAGSHVSRPKEALGKGTFDCHMMISEVKYNRQRPLSTLTRLLRER